MFRDDHRLIPYNPVVFGVHASPGYQLYDDTHTLNTTFDGERHEYGQPLFIIKWNKVEYKIVKEKHANYWTWKKNRNETRGDLEEAHGYDTKHAMHLVRLLRMGVEALRDEEIVVKRPDAEELLAIRDGAWTYEEIVEYAEQMDAEVKGVWYEQTKLRKKPNIQFAANLLMDAQKRLWG